MRPTEDSFRDAQATGRPWPISFDTLLAYVRRVERVLAVRGGRVPPDFRAIRSSLGLDVLPKRAAVHLSGRRPLNALDWCPGPSIRPHAIVTRILFDNERHATGVEFIDGKASQLRAIRARAVILCASAIETARLLLSSDDGRIGLRDRGVGRGLVDHLVASCLVILERPASAVIAGPLDGAAFIPRFVNLGSHRRRDYRGGFSAEVRGPFPLAQIGQEAIRELGLTIRGARELSFAEVHALGDAPPATRRRVTIDPAATDACGRPLPVVYAAWGHEARRMSRDMRETVAQVASAIGGESARVIPTRDPVSDMYLTHEAGTCRMSASSRTGVTNEYGAVFGTRGLFVADASVLPSALDRHPTLTLLAVALRNCEHVAERLRHADL